MRKRLTTALLLLLALPLTAAGEDAFFLDLSKAANRGFRDEVAGDGVGGWTDQGGNDFRHTPVGDQTLCGVPFRILDPAKNAGKSCLVLRGHGLKGLPDSAMVAVGRKGAALVFLHALAWGDEPPVARYIVRYADGKSGDIPVRQGKEILGWWGAQEAEQVKVAVQSSNLATRKVSIHAWAWTNPRPDAVIESVEFRSTGSQGVPVLVAATLLSRVPTLRSERPQPKVPPDGFILIEAEDFATYNVPPFAEPKDEKAKAGGEKLYPLWPDPHFSGGRLLEIKPPPNLPQVGGGGKPQHLKGAALKLTCNFAADKADTDVLWARVGPANVYSRFRWRVDDGEPGRTTRQDPFLDMWEMGFWVTMGWIRLGERRLEPGKHVLHIEVPQPETKDQLAEREMDTEMDDLLGKTEPMPIPCRRGTAGATAAKSPRPRPPWRGTTPRPPATASASGSPCPTPRWRTAWR